MRNTAEATDSADMASITMTVALPRCEQTEAPERDHEPEHQHDEKAARENTDGWLDEIVSNASVTRG